MPKRPLVGVLPVLLTLALVAIPNGSGAVPTNVDVSQRVGNESEEAIAVNPTDPQNIVVVTNIQEGFSGLFEGVSFDGGKTWAQKIIAAGDAIGGGADGLGDSCCDPSLSFDQYGNLFLSYMAPPLTIGEDEIDLAVEILDASIGAVLADRPELAKV